VTFRACLVVRHDAFDAVGGFPDWLFLNSEDVYLCDRPQRHRQDLRRLRITAGHRKLVLARGVSYDQVLAEVARAESAYARRPVPAAAWFVVYASIGSAWSYEPSSGPECDGSSGRWPTRLWREAGAVRSGNPGGRRRGVSSGSPTGASVARLKFLTVAVVWVRASRGAEGSHTGRLVTTATLRGAWPAHGNRQGFRTRDTTHAADGQPSFCASGIGSAATDDGLS